MNSALYVGWVRHRRTEPVAHEFRYRVFFFALDLAELDQVFAGRWFHSHRHRNLVWFRRQDYLGDPSVPLDQAVRDAVVAAGLPRPQGRIVVVTQLRTLFYVQNPVTFYYCYDAAEDLASVVAEITNTPWGERHRYVLQVPNGVRSPWRFQFRKAFHVSPFLPMDLDYDWNLSDLGPNLAIHMDVLDHGRCVLDATVVAVRRPLRTLDLMFAHSTRPFATARVLLGIYWNAWRLRRKGVTFHRNPSSTTERP